MGCTLLIGQCQRVLSLTADRIVRGYVFGSDAHVNTVKGVVQDAQHVILNLRMAHARTPASGRQQVWAATHGLDPSTDGELGITEHQSVCRRNNCLQARPAEPVDVIGRRLFRNARINGSHSRDISVLRFGWNHVAHHHMANALGLNVAVKQCGLDCRGGQLAHRHVFECAAEGADGCALGAQNKDVGGLHGVSLLF